MTILNRKSHRGRRLVGTTLFALTTLDRLSVNIKEAGVEAEPIPERESNGNFSATLSLFAPNGEIKPPYFLSR
jgi:hypothetical protein